MSLNAYILAYQLKIVLKPNAKTKLFKDRKV